MKSVLILTLAQLAALSLPEAAAVHENVTGKKPSDDLTLDQVFDAILAVADPAPDKDEETDSETFMHEGKKYSVLLPKVEIPGLGIRTKLELLNDEEAQAYLVEQGCVGSVIREVV